MGLRAVNFAKGTEEARSVEEARWLLAEELVMRGYDLWCLLHGSYGCGCEVVRIARELGRRGNAKIERLRRGER